ncbi:hypothetical protein E2562_000364 [Oryza meyeriana var. granulata]|uniref:Uncharacterized protein n=1 Tax=Oryza meyeriana var. granulata TaxID=110450 RepID=A0A6G1CC57_9ORYZ|nr:hypothetical protein E2562_000364 [Oryza meyeriana var. granulata]
MPRSLRLLARRSTVQAATRLLPRPLLRRRGRCEAAAEVAKAEHARPLTRPLLTRRRCRCSPAATAACPVPRSPRLLLARYRGCRSPAAE